MSVEAQAVVSDAGSGVMSSVRALIAKSQNEGLSPSESIFLQGELARLKARVAAVNARVGRRVVELGSFACLAELPGAAC